MVSLDANPEWDAETCSSSNPGTVKLPSATPKYNGPSPKRLGVTGSEILRSIWFRSSWPEIKLTCELTAEASVETANKLELLYPVAPAAWVCPLVGETKEAKEFV